ncbi:MAG: PKD domain-containing protein, partial [Gammaproteobacteria bacterium]|nr:PKD domain-containing protein [Gammaproteobacteria bacterium]
MKTTRILTPLFFGLLLAVLLLAGISHQAAFARAPENPFPAGVPITRARTASQPQAATRYVATSGADTGDCTDAQNPCRTVQYAVDAAGAGDEVRVASGVYTDVNNHGGLAQIVYVSKTVSIRGGYTLTNWTDPDPLANPTTLDAQGQGRVMYITGAISSTVEGLQITNGDATGLGDGGGGIYILTATVTLQNNRITANKTGVYARECKLVSRQNIVSENISGSGGVLVRDVVATFEGDTFANNNPGGMNAHMSQIAISNSAFSGNGASYGGAELATGIYTVTNNTFLTNTAGNHLGGGLSIWNGAGAIKDNLFQGNTAKQGGAVYINLFDGSIQGNTIVGNEAEQGGGLYLFQFFEGWFAGNVVAGNTATQDGGGFVINMSGVEVVNNFITDNWAGEAGSGVFVIEDAYSPQIFAHNTIARNRGGLGDGIHYGGYSPPNALQLINNIIVSHTVGLYLDMWPMVYFESNLWGSGAWANGTDWQGSGEIFTGTANFWGDPGFVDPDGGDYHLLPESAAVDRRMSALYNTDVDGDLRPSGFGVEIGADELAGPVLQVEQSTSALFPYPGDIVTHTIRLTTTHTDGPQPHWFSDTLSSLQRPLTFSISQGVCTSAGVWGASITCDLGSLPPDTHLSLTLVAEVTHTLPAQMPARMRNTAQFTSPGVANTTDFLDTYLQSCRAQLNTGPETFATVQAAIDASTQITDVVKVSGYCLGVAQRNDNMQVAFISKTLTLQGGWDPTFLAWDPVQYPTTLDAYGLGRVLYIEGAAVTPTVQNLHITHGGANTLWSSSQDMCGGGVYIDRSAATLRENHIEHNYTYCGGGAFLSDSMASLTNNTFYKNGSWTRGGAVHISSGTPTLDNNIIHANTSHDSGGGIYVYDSNATISNNIISDNMSIYGGGIVVGSCNAKVSGNIIRDNVAIRNGGGIDTWSNSPLFHKNIIQNNIADYGGGISVFRGSSRIQNNIIVGNEASTEGSGIYVDDANTNISHNTFVQNATTGVRIEDDSNITLTNNIFVGHPIAGVSVQGGGENQATLRHTLWGTGAWANGEDWIGGDNIHLYDNVWGNPGFIAPEAENYHIDYTSAALDAGMDANITADIDSEVRPMGAGFDIGADELGPAIVVSVQASRNYVQPGDRITYTLQATNVGISNLHTTITDVLPSHVTLAGFLTWTADLAAFGGQWSQTVVVTVEIGYTGALTNVVLATSTEGAAGTATSIVFVEIPLTGLTATNDSPTALGQPTTLTVTLGGGGNAGYAWAFGDGVTGTGAVASHTYPAAGTYTAVVTASNDVSALTATTIVTIEVPLTGLTATNDSPTALGQPTTLT